MSGKPRGVRFSFSEAADVPPPVERTSSRKRKSDGDDLFQDMEGRKIIDCNMGILGFHGIYEADAITLVTPAAAISFDASPCPAAHLATASAAGTDHPDGSKIIVHFEAMDVGPFSFGLDFTVGGPDPVTARDHGRVDIKYRVVLHGTVMRKGQGSPALRGNVHHRGDVVLSSDDERAEKASREGAALHAHGEEEEEDLDDNGGMQAQDGS